MRGRMQGVGEENGRRKWELGFLCKMKKSSLFYFLKEIKKEKKAGFIRPCFIRERID